LLGRHCGDPPKQLFEVGSDRRDCPNAIDATRLHDHDARRDSKGFLQIVRHINEREPKLALQSQQFVPQL